MSILLDSLRKSEAQRTHREAPTIHSTRSFDAPANGQRAWPAIVMILLAAGAVAWFGMKQFSMPDGGVSVAQEQAETPAAAPAAQTGGVSTEARTPVERLTQAPVQPAEDEETGSAAAEGQSPADRIASFAAAEEPAAPAPGSSGDAGDSLEPSAPRDGASTEAALAEESSAEESLPEASFSRVEPMPQQRSRREAPPANEPRSYWQLPQSWRSEMPEFRISVLVYADEPEDRFLFINGERKQEGEEIEGGVVLQEIRRDGAVFSYRNQQFLVKS